MYLKASSYPYKARKSVIALPNTFSKILTKDYANLVKTYGQSLEWLTDKESLMEAAMVYYPYYFAEPTEAQITNIGNKPYLEYIDLQASVRNAADKLEFTPLFEGECVLQAFARCFQLLYIMSKFEAMFTNIGKGSGDSSSFDFARKYGEYGAVLSIADGYALSLKEVEGFTAYQVFINLDYLSGKIEAEKLHKQLKGSNATP